MNQMRYGIEYHLSMPELNEEINLDEIENIQLRAEKGQNQKTTYRTQSLAKRKILIMGLSSVLSF